MPLMCAYGRRATINGWLRRRKRPADVPSSTSPGGQRRETRENPHDQVAKRVYLPKDQTRGSRIYTSAMDLGVAEMQCGAGPA